MINWPPSARVACQTSLSGRAGQLAFGRPTCASRVSRLLAFVVDMGRRGANSIIRRLARSLAHLWDFPLRLIEVARRNFKSGWRASPKQRSSRRSSTCGVQLVCAQGATLSAWARSICRARASKVASELDETGGDECSAVQSSSVWTRVGQASGSIMLAASVWANIN